MINSGCGVSACFQIWWLLSCFWQLGEERKWGEGTREREREGDDVGWVTQRNNWTGAEEEVGKGPWRSSKDLVDVPVTLPLQVFTGFLGTQTPTWCIHLAGLTAPSLSPDVWFGDIRLPCWSPSISCSSPPPFCFFLPHPSLDAQIAFIFQNLCLQDFLFPTRCNPIPLKMPWCPICISLKVPTELCLAL